MKIYSILAAAFFLAFFCTLHVSAQTPRSSRLFNVPPITILNDENPTGGYLFLATLNFDNNTSKHLLILDEHGTVVFDRENPLGSKSNLADFKSQPGNRYSFFDFSENAYIILDKNFHTIDTVRAVGYQTDNHELLIDEKNHYFLMGTEQRIINMADSIRGGNPSANVIGIVVQELDSEKNVVFEWKTLDHLPVTQSKGVDLASDQIDYIHTNSLWVDTDSTILLSNRHLNEITKVSTKTGHIVWRMGLNSSGNEFTFVNDSLGFSYQHCVQRLPNGNIILFDNGNYRRGSQFSRACEYKIDEEKKTATLVWQYRNSPDLFSAFMGSVQRLQNGNTLIGWGGATPSATEVDSLGNKVFECSFSTTVPEYSYRAFKFDIPNIDSLRSSRLVIPDSVAILSQNLQDILKEILGDSLFAQNSSIYFLTNIDSATATVAYRNPNDFISYKTVTLLENTVTSIRLDTAPPTETRVTIYPNPSTGDFKMNIINTEEAIPVAIYNSFGQLVIEKKVLESDTFNNFPVGVYTMIVSLRHQNLRCKFVITR